MNDLSALQTGLNAIQNGIRESSRHAHKIAQPAATGEQVTESLIGFNAAKHQVQAAARVIETSHEMIGTLLDIRV